MTYNRIPYAVMGLGGLLGGIMLLGIVLAAVSPVSFSVPILANFVSSILFVAAIVGGGYWLLRSDLRTDRYRRITAWVIVGTTFFVGFALLTVLGQNDWLTRVGILRWSASIGAGAGLLAGLLEARAIDRAIAVERTRMHNQKLQRVNVRLEEYASIIAHDLRNPLNVASAYIETTRGLRRRPPR